MESEIFIISGFLGAGKTTFIQKLLEEAFQKDKVVLIENDFGEISVDAALMKAGGIEVKELNSGCICCSLSGDFVKSLKEVSECFHPDKIIIEPSGVGKLSDIVSACADKRLSGLYQISAKITVADAGRCRSYLDNFGEFFEDQIENADIVLLSRVEAFPDKVKEARGLIEKLNHRAAIFSLPWNSLNSADILASIKSAEGFRTCRCHHEGHEECDCNHKAEEVFDTVTVRTDRKYSASEISSLMETAERELSGSILRAKGILRGKKGYLDFQYVPGNSEVKDCRAKGGMICFIGRNLDRAGLSKLFHGK